jgi:hypothetical protein
MTPRTRAFRVAYVALIAAFFFGALGFIVAHADDVFYQQLTKTYTDPGGGNGIPFGSGMNGLATTLTLSASAAATQTPTLTIYCYTDSGYSIPCAVPSYTSTASTITGGAGQNDVAFDFSGDPVTLSPTDYYSVYLPGSIHWWGTGSPNYYPYAILSGTMNVNTRIVASIIPTNGSTTPSTSVELKFTYFYNDTQTPTYDTAGVFIQDLTAPQSIAAPEETINASGFSTYDETQTLTTAHEYLWTPYLRSSTSTDRIMGTMQSFFVVSNPYPIDLNIASSSIASTTAQQIPLFSNLLDTIKHAPPFGVIFQIIDDVNGIGTSTPEVYLRPSVQIYSVIFSPFDTGLAGLVGFLLLVYLWKRFVHIEL